MTAVTKKKAPPAAPWAPIEWANCLPQIHALRAVAAGTATAEQQREFFRWVVEDLCKTYDLSFRPGNPEDTTFAEAKRFIGLQIVKLLKIRLNVDTAKSEQGE